MIYSAQFLFLSDHKHDQTSSNIRGNIYTKILIPANIWCILTIYLWCSCSWLSRKVDHNDNVCRETNKMKFSSSSLSHSHSPPPYRITRSVYWGKFINLDLECEIFGWSVSRRVIVSWWMFSGVFSPPSLPPHKCCERRSLIQSRSPAKLGRKIRQSFHRIQNNNSKTLYLMNWFSQHLGNFSLCQISY